MIKVCVNCLDVFTSVYSQRIYCDACRIDRSCTIEDCDRSVRKRKGIAEGNLCYSHWRRRRNGQPMDLAIKRMSGGHLSTQGYVMFSQAVGDGTYIKVAEHRQIMEEHLGRQLLPNENVHHINGVRTDNRIENLEIWVVGQPSGQRLSDKIQWAKEFLREHGEL